MLLSFCDNYILELKLNQAIIKLYSIKPNVAPKVGVTYYEHLQHKYQPEHAFWERINN